MTGRRARAVVAGLLLAPVVAMLLLAAARPPQASGGPPAEELAFERVVFDDQGISVLVRAGAAGAVRIAQVQVDGAFWEFAQDPLGPLPRLSAGRLRIPYPWVFGERHQIAVVTGRGAVFAHRTQPAVPSEARENLPLIGLLAAAIGLLPVALAGAVSPVLEAVRRGGGDLAFAGSVALLLALLTAIARLALASAAEAGLAPQGGALVWLAAGGTAVGLLAAGRLGRAPSVAWRRAALTALAVGAHRFCQGLAVGGAVMVGAVPLALCLALGFAWHNLLAGAGLHRTLAAGPSPRWALAAPLALPPLAGAWLGGQAVAPLWAALALAAGAGAIVQVVAGAMRFAVQRAGRGFRPRPAVGFAHRSR